MSTDAAQSSRPPVNLKGLQEQVLLSAALMRFDAQLRNFTPLRDRLLAAGQDANATYRQIESRRDHVMAELKKLTPAPVAAQPPFHPPRPGPVLSVPIAPASFFPPRNSPWFGFAGSVQMGRAHEGDQIVPPGTTGFLYDWQLQDTGGIWFGGQLVGGPVDGQPKEHFWLHSWVYLLPFPAPVVESTFTYSFIVPIEVATVTASGGVTLWSFVSVGETPDFAGQEVVVNKVVGFPLVADLNAPSQEVLGQSNVQRSFVVNAGHVPAVAVALGVVAALESGAELHIQDDVSFILPGRLVGDGLVDFRYDPILISK
jgi:hypothetical protein